MKRKIYDSLLKWKAESQGETAILIDGARHVGKNNYCRRYGYSVRAVKE